MSTSKALFLALPSLFLVSCGSPDKPEPRKTAAPAPMMPATPAVSPTPLTTNVGDVRVTPSGLKYEVLQRGTGTVHPLPTDTVTVHYHGRLLDGTVFDSSLQRGEPTTFPLNGVIRGWTEGVQLMTVGDKFKFTIPSHLAYGINSPSPMIPPMSTLVFDIELLSINGSTN